MADISVNDVLKLAKLAKLQLTQEELNEFADELDSIIKYVELLNDFDTTGLEQTSQVTGLTNAMRKDELVNYRESQMDLIKNVPKIDNGYIKVRRMLG